MSDFVVYDAGALLAAERKQRRFQALHCAMLDSRQTPVVPIPVYAQVYRGEARQHELHMLIRQVTLHVADRGIAEMAGTALARTGTRDAVDALVAATAYTLSAPVVTSDRGDIAALLDALNAPKHPMFEI